MTPSLLGIEASDANDVATYLRSELGLRGQGRLAGALAGCPPMLMYHTWDNLRKKARRTSFFEHAGSSWAAFLGREWACVGNETGCHIFPPKQEGGGVCVVFCFLLGEVSVLRAAKRGVRGGRIISACLNHSEQVSLLARLSPMVFCVNAFWCELWCHSPQSPFRTVQYLTHIYGFCLERTVVVGTPRQTPRRRSRTTAKRWRGRTTTWRRCWLSTRTSCPSRWRTTS